MRCMLADSPQRAVSERYVAGAKWVRDDGTLWGVAGYGPDPEAAMQALAVELYNSARAEP